MDVVVYLLVQCFVVTRFLRKLPFLFPYIPSCILYLLSGLSAYVLVAAEATKGSRRKLSL